MAEIDLRSAERQIDDLIERRAAERQQANAAVYAEAAEVRRYDLRRAAEIRRAHIDFHLHLAGVFETRAEHHRQAAGHLIDGAAKRP